MRRWIVAFISAVIVFVSLDILLAGHGHDVFPWSGIAGFFAAFGLLGCLLIIGFAKLIGRFWLQRREEYYDRNNDSE